MIQLLQATLTRHNRELVSAVSATIQPGRMTALLGSNGAGKTSLVRLLSAELDPTSGSVLWCNRPRSDWGGPALARWRAVVPQSSQLSFSFRVLDVVLLGRLPHGWAVGSRDVEIAEAALAAVNLLPLRDRDAATLSGGERQRMHLARALAQLHEARARGQGFLLLDETTAHLDLTHQQQILQLARQLAGEGLAVLTVLHDLNLAARFADTVMLMREGQLVAAGRPEDVLTPELIRAVFAAEVMRVSVPDGTTALLPVCRPRHPGTHQPITAEQKNEGVLA